MVKLGERFRNPNRRKSGQGVWPPQIPSSLDFSASKRVKAVNTSLGVIGEIA